MPDIFLDFRPRVNEAQLIKLQDVLEDADNQDEIAITLDTGDAHEADDIFEMLDEYQYGYYSKGGDGAEYNIIASKKYFQDQL